MRYNIQVRGVKKLDFRFMSLTQQMSQSQLEKGNEWGNFFANKARARIQRLQASGASGQLMESIDFNTNKVSRGYSTRIFTNKPYAEIVHSGGTPQRKTITKGNDLYNWYANTFNEKIANYLAKIGHVTVRQGGNPNYESWEGMRFFQIPLENNLGKVVDSYQNMATSVIYRSRLK